MSQVWIVADVKRFAADGWADDWEFAGVFTTRAAAAAACTRPGMCLFSAELDALVPNAEVTTRPPDLAYPAGAGMRRG